MTVAGDLARTDPAPGPVRSDIIDAATKVFSERGYHAASMSEIADVLGMRKPSLYHHVRKKEDLLYAIHEQLIEELIEETTAVCEGDKSPSELLHDVLLVNMRFVARRKDGVTVFLQERRAVTGERWETLVARRDHYERMLRQIIIDGVEAGVFVDVPPDIAARGVLAMANWGYTWFQPDGRLTPEQVAETFAAIVLSGLERR